jgi:hypothetical protein
MVVTRGDKFAGSSLALGVISMKLIIPEVTFLKQIG